MSRQTVKDITINSPSGGTGSTRDIGAEAQCIEVSRDALGNIIEDIDATGVVVDSVQPLSETLKDIEDNKQNTLTFDSVPTSGSSNSVTSGGIYSFTTGGQVALNNSQPVTGGEVFSKLNNAIKGDSVSTKVAKTGTDTTSITNSIASGTTLDNSIQTLLNNDVTNGSEIQALANQKADKPLVITLPNVSASKLSYTSSDVVAIANVNANHVVIESVLSNPSIQTGDWTITTGSNSIIVSGSIASSGTTNLTLTLIEKA